MRSPVTMWRAWRRLPDWPDCLAWSWWRWQAHYAARGVALRHIGSRPAVYPPPAWWLFPRYLIDTDAKTVVTTRLWWRTTWWRYVASPFYRCVERWGVYRVREGDYYRNGRWTWPPRRTPAS